jgi:hypothetical protein
VIGGLADRGQNFVGSHVNRFAKQFGRIFVSILLTPFPTTVIPLSRNAKNQTKKSKRYFTPSQHSQVNSIERECS